MKFSIAGTVYDVADLDRITLKSILEFEQQSADFGRPLTWAQVGTWSQELADLKTDAEREAHPGGLWLMAVTIWASRVLAGEPITFSQAVDFPMADLVQIPDPQDRKAPANPTKARTRKGSGGAVSALRAASPPAETPTSEPVSTSA